MSRTPACQFVWGLMGPAARGEGRAVSLLGTVAHPLFLFLLVWGATTALYLAGVFGGLFPSPRALTVGALFLNAVGFCLGYLTWTLVRRRRPPGGDLPEPWGPPATPRRIRHALTLTWRMGVMTLVLMLYRVGAIAVGTGTGYRELLTQPEMLRLRLVTFIEAGTSQASLLVMLISLMGSLYALGFVLLGVFLHIDKTGRRYIYLPGFLLVALGISLVNLGRYDMTLNVLYLVLAYCVVGSCACRERSHPTFAHLALPVLGVVAIFALVEVLLPKSVHYDQPDRFRGVLFSLYWYLASPVAAFDEFLAGFHGHYELGQNLSFPFYKWLHRFNLVGEPDFTVYAEFVFVPYLANAYTYLRVFYEDFGLLGVVVVPYVLGGLLAIVQRRAHRSVPYLNLYVVLLAPIALSFFNFSLLSIQFYLQILFGFLLFPFVLAESRRECTH